MNQPEPARHGPGDGSRGMTMLYPDRMLLIALAILAHAPAWAKDARPRQPVCLYVATNSPRDGEGVFVATFDQGRGRLGELRPTGGLKSPAYLAIHPRGGVVYAPTKLSGNNAASSGGVVALVRDAETGALREIGRRPSGGDGPCYLALDQAGECLLVAHCGAGGVSCLKLNSDGSCGTLAHSILATPGDQFAVSADLGLDRLFLYRLDVRRAQLTTHQPPFVPLTIGAGPRHLAFDPRGRFLYSANELGNTVTALEFNRETGQAKVLQELSTLPADYRGESFAAEIQVHPSGRFLYVSNRGHDSLATFAIDSRTGRLERKGFTASGGKFPRHFTMDSTGEYLIVANQKSDRLTLFRVDIESGRLTLHRDPIKVAAPVCVRFALPSRP